MQLARILNHTHMLALPSTIAKLGNGGCRIAHKARFIGRVYPGFGHNACAIPWSDLRLIRLDDGIQRSGVDIAFLRQDRFKRTNAQRGF